MSQLSKKQIYNRWREIKKNLRQRPLLAYTVNIPYEKWNTYMYSIPDPDEVNRVYDTIEKDRIEKTYRIKKELSKMVGYRESKEYSRKSRVSDTYIRQIIEGKKEKAGYSIIDKLELFISRVNPEFEPSIKNSLDIKSYSLDHLAGVANEIKNISNGLNRYC